jgi:transcriptional regulator with XRE-family HTH domain
MQLGLSQQAVADRLGWAQSKVGRIETGFSEPTLADLHPLAEVLDVNVMDLISGAAAKPVPAITVTASVTCADHGVVASGLTAEKARQVRAEHIDEHLAGSP